MAAQYLDRAVLATAITAASAASMQHIATWIITGCRDRPVGA
jgi:hypothetical protein